MTKEEATKHYEDVARDVGLVEGVFAFVQPWPELAAGKEALSRLATAAARVPGLLEERAQMLEQVARSTREAQSCMAERNRATAELEAEQAGRLEFRKRFGALEAETFGAFVERLASERDAARQEAENQQHSMHELREELAEVRQERDALTARVAEVERNLTNHKTAVDGLEGLWEQQKARATAAESKAQDMEALLAMPANKARARYLKEARDAHARAEGFKARIEEVETAERMRELEYHDGKTWVPSVNVAATMLARARAEAKRENALLKAAADGISLDDMTPADRSNAELAWGCAGSIKTALRRERGNRMEAVRKAAEDMRERAEQVAYEAAAATRHPEQRDRLLALGHAIRALPLE